MQLASISVAASSLAYSRRIESTSAARRTVVVKGTKLRALSRSQ